MTTFLISLLVLLFYAGIAILVLVAIFYLFAQIAGREVTPRVKQIIYALVGILFLIWFLEVVTIGTPIQMPWNLHR